MISDIDIDHHALTSANAAAANTPAVSGDNTEDFSLEDMISADKMSLGTA